jgi:hypothetical protein
MEIGWRLGWHLSITMSYCDITMTNYYDREMVVLKPGGKEMNLYYILV